MKLGYNNNTRELVDSYKYGENIVWKLKSEEPIQERIILRVLDFFNNNNLSLLEIDEYLMNEKDCTKEQRDELLMALIFILRI